MSNMRKTADEELVDRRIPTLEHCPNCKSARLKCQVSVGVGTCRPKTKYCDSCGYTKDIARG